MMMLWKDDDENTKMLMIVETDPRQLQETQNKMNGCQSFSIATSTPGDSIVHSPTPICIGGHSIPSRAFVSCHKWSLSPFFLSSLKPFLFAPFSLFLSVSFFTIATDLTFRTRTIPTLSTFHTHTTTAKHKERVLGVKTSSCNDDTSGECTAQEPARVKNVVQDGVQLTARQGVADTDPLWRPNHTNRLCCVLLDRLLHVPWSPRENCLQHTTPHHCSHRAPHPAVPSLYHTPNNTCHKPVTS